MWNWHGNRTGWHVYWSPEDPAAGGAGGGQGAGAGANSGAGGSSAATGNTEHMIPKSRFDEVNDELKQLREQVRTQQTDAQTREQERLVKQGEWQTIAETEKKRSSELEPKAARAEVLEKAIAEGNRQRVERIPEANRSLIPADYPPERLSAYLDANWERLVGKVAPNIDAGAGGGSGTPPAPLTAEEKVVAAATGMTEAQWNEAKKKAGQGG